MIIEKKKRTIVILELDELEAVQLSRWLCALKTANTEVENFDELSKFQANISQALLS